MISHPVIRNEIYEHCSFWYSLHIISHHIHLNKAKFEKNTFGILQRLRNSGALYRPLLVSWSSASSIVSSSRWKCITRWRVSIGSTEPGLKLEKLRILFNTYPQILSWNTNLNKSDNYPLLTLLCQPICHRTLKLWDRPV